MLHVWINGLDIFPNVSFTVVSILLLYVALLTCYFIYVQSSNIDYIKQNDVAFASDGVIGIRNINTGENVQENAVIACKNG